MEGILEIDNYASEKKEFEELLIDLKKDHRYDKLCVLLDQINKDKQKFDAIRTSLYSKDLDFECFRSLISDENKPALSALGILLAHWETPKDGFPKTAHDHLEDSNGFVKLILQK